MAQEGTHMAYLILYQIAIAMLARNKLSSGKLVALVNS